MILRRTLGSLAVLAATAAALPQAAMAQQSCSLSGPSQVAPLQSYTFQIGFVFSPVPPVLYGYWEGFNNNVRIAPEPFNPLAIPTYVNQPGVAGNYVRWARIEDASGRPYCQTNEMSVWLQ